MGYKWITAKEGIRYREHPTRKHGVRFDRYYTIRYRKPNGERFEEMLGWASKTGMTTAKAAAELTKLKEQEVKNVSLNLLVSESLAAAC